MQAFWAIVDRYTEARWWFGTPAALALGAAVLLCLFALARLRKRNLLSILVAVPALSAAVALLLPGALISWQPERFLGLDTSALASLPSATFPAVANLLDRTMQMGYIGSGLLLVGGLALVSTHGARRLRSCPTCGRELHPSWQGACPECQLMAPGAAESPLMRLGDASASGIQVTQFVTARTELLGGAPDESTWIEVVSGGSGSGERFAVGARLTIGRDLAQCQVVLDDETVSSHHAAIEHENQEFVLYDRGSRNGTFVNDARVTRQVLSDGDRVQVGRTILCFKSQDASLDSSPTVLLDVGVQNARLVGVGGPIDGRQFPLSQFELRIGRGRQNDIVLEVPTVSRHHATIRYDGQDYNLLDAGAHNGTWLDDVRVLGSSPLHSGQVIRFGAQQLRFEQEEAHDASLN